LTEDNKKSIDLSTRLYRAEQVRAMDRVAIDQLGIPGLFLMKRAGQAAFDCLKEQWPAAKSILVICGAGNNAGDGYVIARLAIESGLAVAVCSLVDPEKLRGDAKLAWQEYLQAGGDVELFSENSFSGKDIVVDAMLGTGLDREVSGGFADAIAKLNQNKIPVLALDIPSGLNADTGVPLGNAVRATQTVTFIGVKQGLYTGESRDYTGSIDFDSLAVPADVFDSQIPAAWLLTDPSSNFTRRPRSSHKGYFGHLLVVGGDTGFCGAARMAAQAGARIGAGLVSVATRASHAVFLNISQPELMCRGVESVDEMQVLLQKASVIAIGPGLGLNDWGLRIFESVIQESKPLVVDADALTLLSQYPTRKDNWVLTPHPGEAGRLLGTHSVDIQRDRFAAAKAIQSKYGGICVLKGAGTIIHNGETTSVCPTGNPGMASGGMGDILTGVIAGLVAQGDSIHSAAETGVFVHGQAADIAATDGERGLLASDLLEPLRRLVNP